MWETFTFFFDSILLRLNLAFFYSSFIFFIVFSTKDLELESLLIIFWADIEFSKNECPECSMIQFWQKPMSQSTQKNLEGMSTGRDYFVTFRGVDIFRRSRIFVCLLKHFLNGWAPCSFWGSWRPECSKNSGLGGRKAYMATGGAVGRFLGELGDALLAESVPARQQPWHDVVVVE